MNKKTLADTRRILGESVEEKQEPKFKVGDVVKYKEATMTAKVLEVIDDYEPTYKIKFEDGIEKTDGETNLELVKAVGEKELDEGKMPVGRGDVERTKLKEGKENIDESVQSEKNKALKAKEYLKAMKGTNLQQSDKDSLDISIGIIDDYVQRVFGKEDVIKEETEKTFKVTAREAREKGAIGAFQKFKPMTVKANTKKDVREKLYDMFDSIHDLSIEEVGGKDTMKEAVEFPTHVKDSLLMGFDFEELIDTIVSNEKVHDEATVKKVFDEMVKTSVENAKESLKSEMPMILKQLNKIKE